MTGNASKIYFEEGKYYFIGNGTLDLNQSENKEIFLVGPYDNYNIETERQIIKYKNNMGLILKGNLGIRYIFEQDFKNFFYSMKQGFLYHTTLLWYYLGLVLNLLIEPFLHSYS